MRSMTSAAWSSPHTRKNHGRSMFYRVEEFYLNLKRHETPLSLLFIRARPDDATALLPHLAAGAVSAAEVCSPRHAPRPPFQRVAPPSVSTTCSSILPEIPNIGHGLPALGGRQGFCRRYRTPPSPWMRDYINGEPFVIVMRIHHTFRILCAQLCRQKARVESAGRPSEICGGALATQVRHSPVLAKNLRSPRGGSLAPRCVGQFAARVMDTQVPRNAANKTRWMKTKKGEAWGLG